MHDVSPPSKKPRLREHATARDHTSGRPRLPSSDAEKVCVVRGRSRNSTAFACSAFANNCRTPTGPRVFADFVRVNDTHDADQLIAAARMLSEKHGPLASDCHGA